MICARAGLAKSVRTVTIAIFILDSFQAALAAALVQGRHYRLERRCFVHGAERGRGLRPCQLCQDEPQRDRNESAKPKPRDFQGGFHRRGLGRTNQCDGRDEHARSETTHQTGQDMVRHGTRSTLRPLRRTIRRNSAEARARCECRCTRAQRRLRLSMGARGDWRGIGLPEKRGVCRGACRA